MEGPFLERQLLRGNHWLDQRGEYPSLHRAAEDVSDVNIAIKYRIYPTDEQKALFAKTFGCCRKVCDATLVPLGEFDARRSGGCVLV